MKLVVILLKTGDYEDEERDYEEVGAADSIEAEGEEGDYGEDD